MIMMMMIVNVHLVAYLVVGNTCIVKCVKENTCILLQHTITPICYFL